MKTPEKILKHKKIYFTQFLVECLKNNNEHWNPCQIQ